MSQFFKALSAIAHSGKFQALLRGVEIELPSGQRLTVRVGETIRSMRPKGLRFSKYSFVSEVRAGEFTGWGYGEDDSKVLSLQKSIAEGFERVVYKAFKETSHGTLNTNGWSAHIDSKKATQSAIEELLERDAVLVHWLSRQPMQTISQAESPDWLQRWVREELSLSPEFKNLRVLVSTLGFVPVVTTVLEKDHTHGVLSSAAGGTLEEATRKALAETCRIGHIALEQKEISEKIETPIDHAVLFMEREALPTWLYGEVVDWTSASNKWNADYRSFDQRQINPVFHQITTSPLAVGYCSSHEIQNLYFGRTEIAQSKGLINFRRLNRALQGRDLNLSPHCVA